MIPDSRWEFCWYHQMGSYFEVENGLWRLQEQKKDRLLNVVFPALNSNRDESITKKTTAVIRKNLHKDFPPNIKQSFTAKSLHQDSIGELTLYSDITVFQACGRISHSTNTSIDLYIDTSHPSKAIPAANVLAGKSNIHAHIVLPKLNAIGLMNAAQVDKLLDKLIPGQCTSLQQRWSFARSHTHMRSILDHAS
jgi:hypothetical protein